jgi:hypothetical protein
VRLLLSSPGAVGAAGIPDALVIPRRHGRRGDPGR